MASNVRDLRGYDHDFVEKPPNDLLCLICLCVARNPQQINCCGKLLCKGCLKQHKKCSFYCPQCRTYMYMNSFSDKKSKLKKKCMIIYMYYYCDIHITGERDILSLKAQCDNTKSGCGWVGELCSLDKHLASCDYTLLPCPNECHRGREGKKPKYVQLLCKDLKEHIGVSVTPV